MISTPSLEKAWKVARIVLPPLSVAVLVDAIWRAAAHGFAPLYASAAAWCLFCTLVTIRAAWKP
jgi:hypothetical protein